MKGQRQSKPALTIIDAMSDPMIFGPWFQSRSWVAWRAFLKVLFALPIDRPSLQTFRKHTGSGRPIRDFRHAWKKASTAAGFPNLLFHDLRRSAIRNFDRAGVSQTVGMKLSGHKTPSVYRRYRIVDEAELRQALELTQAKNAECNKRRVVPISVAAEAGR